VLDGGHVGRTIHELTATLLPVNASVTAYIGAI